MKLISATPSPYARKIRIALAEKGIAFDLMTEVPWNDDTSLPQHNPLEKLPVLLPDGGEPLFQSSYIMEWLERRYPEPPLLPADDDGILAHKRIEVIADGICDAVILIMFERMRPQGHQSEPWILRQKRKIDGGVAELARLIKRGPHAIGDGFGLADIAAGSALGYLGVRFPEKDWRTAFPDLATYADRLFARPSFAGTTPVAQTIRDRVV
ncbi:glutathione S-transferase N-terminal domain-containing protein [Beijerinckia sp. L45]|uniref:glutathione S-transferase N-terminal domain-containing protein n=1 Tax=Beijerinckia sp. L45 TaxID=1641855 RepID=UPI00131C860A|nr:glutathione S-transferase N-terminal domain-containing protein [Beijerinckia sp. L45]